MKRIYFSTIILLISTYLASASPITPEKARSVALKYMNCNSVTLCSDSFTLLGTKASSLEAPAYYVFNAQADGWVIISGEDTTIPVLAVGDKGKFVTDNMPEHVKYWMERMSSTVRSIRQDASIKQSAEIKALWANPRPIKMSAVTQKYLPTPSWGQNYPYNDYCPKDLSGTKTITGCVATAMAEVLRYNAYPSKGTGTIPAYTSARGISLDAIDISNHTYNWDIPYEYSSSWNNNQKKAVATLMLHCGCMVEMDYGSSSSGGSSAYSNSIPAALSTYMGYSKATCLRYRQKDSPSEWIKTITNEIDANRPILYGGSNLIGDGAHQFVLDGYDSDNKVHINWGWSGLDNGWFAVNYLGIVQSEYVFSDKDCAIIGLIPDEKGTSDPYGSPLITIGAYYGPDYTGNQGFEVTPTNLLGTFSIYLPCYANYSEFTYSGTLKLCLADNDGIKETISSKTYSAFNYLAAYSWSFNNTSLKSIPKIGDFVALFYSNPAENYIKANRYKSLDPLKVLDKLNPFDFSIITIPATIKAGNVIYPEVLHRNVRLNSETWTLDGKAIDIGNFTATAGEHTLEVKLEYTDGSSETVKKKFTVN